MDKKKIIIIAGSVGLSLAMVGIALVMSMRSNVGSDAPVIAPHTVTKAELAAADGKDGHACLVAVDGTVYQIRGFALWEAGRHQPSNGQAYCGADMSKVITKSPHGRKILKLLINIGPLQ